MTRILLTALAISAGFCAQTTMAQADQPYWLDRLEDRVDRRESYRDRQVDHGPLDVVEDRIDFVEGRLDRRGFEVTPRIDRHERRSWRRHWVVGHND